MIYFNNATDSFPKLQCVNDFLSNQEYFISGRECSCIKDTKKQVTEIFRSKIKEILNLPDDFLVTITHGATEAANLVIQSFYKQKGYDDYVIIDHSCHNSVIRPCYELYGDQNCYIIKNKDWNPSLFEKDSVFNNCFNYVPIRNCRLMIFSYQCNVTGTVFQNIKDIIQFIEYNDMSNTTLILDITQAIGNTKIDLTDILSGSNFRNVYLFGTTHKSLGSISGTGFLVHPSDNNLIPLIYGGTGIGTNKQPREFPHYLESGTYNITSLACANRAIDYSMSFLEVEQKAKEQLVNYFIKKYNQIANDYMRKNIKIQSRFINPSSGIINLIPIHDYLGEYLVTELFKRGFITRYGCHCCSKYQYIDFDDEKCNFYNKTLRISFNSLNTTNEIDQFFDALSDIVIQIAKNVK